MRQEAERGSDNAEHELRRAYDHVIQAEMVYHAPPGSQEELTLHDLVSMYKHAFRRYRDHHALSAERWSRTAIHLALAFFLEAKIEFLEKRSTDLPYLIGGTSEDYGLVHQKLDTVGDLLDSVAQHIPSGFETMPDLMERCLKRARTHLQRLDDPEYRHELLRADRIKAAYEFGRVLEAIALAYEADSHTRAA